MLCLSYWTIAKHPLLSRATPPLPPLPPRTFTEQPSLTDSLQQKGSSYLCSQDADTVRNTLCQLAFSPSCCSFLVKKYSLNTSWMQCSFLLLKTLAVNKTNEVSALGGLREGCEGRRGGRPVNGRYTAFREQCVQGRKGDG